MTDFSKASLYGKGVFTTIAVVNSRALFWSAHWERLAVHAARVGVEIATFAEQEVVDSVTEKIKKNRLSNGRIRLTFSDELPSEIWNLQQSTCSSVALSILVGQERTTPEYLQLAVSPFPINSCSPLAGVKSCNYLEQILSLDEARGRGFHEAVRVNERGHITSGCMSNIFWLKNDRLYTPMLATGCLAGTTREYVLENIEGEEVEAEIGQLESAEAIYLTSAGLGIVRVAEFDGRELADTKHPIQALWPPS